MNLVLWVFWWLIEGIRSALYIPWGWCKECSFKVAKLSDTSRSKRKGVRCMIQNGKAGPVDLETFSKSWRACRAVENLCLMKADYHQKGCYDLEFDWFDKKVSLNNDVIRFNDLLKNKDKRKTEEEETYAGGCSSGERGFKPPVDSDDGDQRTFGRPRTGRPNRCGNREKSKVKYLDYYERRRASRGIGRTFGKFPCEPRKSDLPAEPGPKEVPVGNAHEGVLSPEMGQRNFVLFDAQSNVYDDDLHPGVPNNACPRGEGRRKRNKKIYSGNGRNRSPDDYILDLYLDTGDPYPSKKRFCPSDR